MYETDQELRNQKIKDTIDRNNKLIQDFCKPNQFTLNNAVKDLLLENAELQKECSHVFDETGICIYCYLLKGENN